MPAKNPAAVALGKLGKGKPKQLTAADRKRRADLMRANQQKRWKKQPEK